ncbi:MAG: redoxin domain-containing protein [Chloroflexi bacterium]|nr:MAG: redoxin domain-containing protein [Chloroflexota bacterium]
MSEKRGAPSSGRSKSKPRRPPVRSPYGQWWPYAIAGGVVVLVAAFVAVTQLGRGGPDGARGSSGNGLAVGSPAPTDSVPSSSGRTVSLADFHGSKVVVYFYEGGT